MRLANCLHKLNSEFCWILGTLYQTLVQFWIDLIAKGKELQLTAEVLIFNEPFIYIEVAAKSFLSEWKALKEQLHVRSKKDIIPT